MFPLCISHSDFPRIDFNSRLNWNKVISLEYVLNDGGLSMMVIHATNK